MISFSFLAALERRLIALEERKFLKDKGVVTEEQVTLGKFNMLNSEVLVMLPW